MFGVPNSILSLGLVGSEEVDFDPMVLKRLFVGTYLVASLNQRVIRAATTCCANALISITFQVKEFEWILINKSSDRLFRY